MIVPAAARFAADHGWLQAHFLFSFAHHVDPENLGFGPLRVFNDEEIAPRAGFSLHPHSEMEIVTIVLDGTLTQHDATGQLVATTEAGEVHRLTAGVGMQHQEANRSRVPLHRYQLWFQASQAGLQPAQENRALDFLTRLNTWVPLVSGRGDGGGAALFINCDTTVWWANLAAGQPLAYASPRDPASPAAVRRCLLYVAAGALTVNGHHVAAGDHLRLENTTTLTLAAAEAASVVLVDLPG